MVGLRIHDELERRRPSFRGGLDGPHRLDHAAVVIAILPAGQNQHWHLEARGDQARVPDEVGLRIVRDDGRDELGHARCVDERPAAAAREPDHRRLARNRLRGVLRPLDCFSEISGAVLLAREDVLAVEKHGVVAEPRDLGGVRVVEARSRMAGQQDDNRPPAAARRVGGLGGALGSGRGRDAAGRARRGGEQHQRAAGAQSSRGHAPSVARGPDAGNGRHVE